MTLDFLDIEFKLHVKFKIVPSFELESQSVN